MSKLNIKTGDTVLVIAGKDNGKVSTVKSVAPKSHKIVVDGVNILTKAKKARRADEKSEIVKVEGPIEISNVMVVCPTCNKATRVARQNVDGKSVRICKKCGASLDVEKKAKKTAKKAVKAEKVEEVAPKATKAKATKSTKTTTTKKAPVKATKSADAKSTKTTAAKKTSTKKVAKETEGDK